MKDFFRSRGFKMLIAAVLLLSGAMLYTASIGGFSSITSSLFGLITTPMQGLSTDGAQAAGDLIDKAANNLDELRAQNEALKEELNKKNGQLSDYYDVKKENEQLKKYLGIKDANPEWELASASVVGRDPNDLFYGFTINKGSLAGVRPGDPVITESGLVGKVVKVGATYSKVSTLFSPSVQAAAICSRTGDAGVMAGDKEWADQNRLLLSQLDPKASLEPGDLISSSGMGGVFPAGVVIGEVESVLSGGPDISLTAVVKPAMDLRAVTDVLVVTSFEGKGEVMEDLYEE